MTVKATKRTYAIAMILMTGVTPWGRALGEPGMILIPSDSYGGRYSPARWAGCCGHVLTPRAMDQWIADGLAVEIEPADPGAGPKWRRVAPGPNLEPWIAQAFDGMKVQRWGQTA